ncbi:MAG: DinB family protein [Phycisphaeraceae bacterium]|nr:DinB family protein [Phycisphaeraceae bacterium]
MTQAPTTDQAPDQAPDQATTQPCGPMCTQLTVLPVETLLEMDWADLVRRFAVGVEWFDPRLFHLAEEDLDRSFKPELGVGRMSIRALVTHLADCDLVYLHRIRRAVAEETPMLGVFDHEAFVEAPFSGPGSHGGVRTAPPVAGAVAVIHTLRRWALDWLFDMDEATQNRAALHPERGSMTVRYLLAVITWHNEYHAAFLNAKVEKLLGPIPQTGPMPQGGCGPGCGCAAKLPNGQSGGSDATT